MSFKNIYYNHKLNKIYLWEEINGEPFFDTIDWSPYVFLKTDKSNTHTIYGDPAVKKDFDSYAEYKDFCKENSGNPNVYENLVKPETQFLAERYYKTPDDEISVPNLLIYSLDIEVLAKEGFPKAMEAKWPVVLISVLNNKTKRTTTFGERPYTGDKDIDYIHCKNERDLLDRFYNFINHNPPDVITGWNCVPTYSYVFGNNQINTIEKIKDDDIIYKHPKSTKKIIKIILSNGKELEISKEHVIPIIYGEGNKYTNFKKNNKNIKNEELKVKDIPIKKYECFIKQPIYDNKNKDVNISDDILYLCGFIFSDGGLRDKIKKTNGYKIWQSDYELLSSFDNILTTKISGPWNRSYCRSIKYSLIGECNHSLIYDNNNNKKLNVHKLSKLSYRQFMIFLSGIFDGDGYISSNTMMICNYENQINNLSILCQWNGMFTTVTPNKIRFLDIKFDDLKLRKYKRWGKFRPYNLKRSSSQKISLIRYKKIYNNYLVKIRDIIYTNEKTKMMDIKTNSNYFISNGIKIHNCYHFDITYLIQRSRKLFGSETNIFQKMSPVGTVRIWNNRKYDEILFDIAGINVLDYMNMFKWYSTDKLERHGLDFVATHVLQTGKLKYDFDDLRGLYNSDWNTYVDYNIVDCELVDRMESKLGYIRLVQSLSLLCKCPMKYYQAMTQLIEGALLTYFRRNDLCAPAFLGGHQKHFPAAYVKEPQKGMHNWEIDVDLTSSYPSHIITLNMSNETYFGRILEIQYTQMAIYTARREFPEFNLSKNGTIIKYSGENLNKFNQAVRKGLLAIAPCGSVFTTIKPGVIAAVEKEIFYKRKEVKNISKILANEAAEMPNSDPEKSAKQERSKELFSHQWSLKILLNAMFGITAVPYSRYFNSNIAEAITSAGRHTILQSEGFVNYLLNNINRELNNIVLEIKNRK